MSTLREVSPEIQAVLAGLLLAVLAYSAYKAAYGTDHPKIKGIPELPNSLPFFGHLKFLGLDHASVFEKFGRQNDWEVIQAKLGNKRILVLNTFAAAQDFMVKNGSATIDRPLFYTFHNVVSKTQGGTVGTAPWNESTKRMRTAAGALMTRPAIQKSAPMLDLETAALVEDLVHEASKTGNLEVDPRIFFQREALNLTLMWCYGTRIADVHDPLLSKILYVAHSVSTFRSTNNNIQDYVPIYRYFGTSKRTQVALNDRNIRDVWLNELYQKVVDATNAGKDVKCISQGLLSEKGDSTLTEAEIKSLNVSFVSGGFETLATSGLMVLAWLTTEQGQLSQDRAFQDIVERHGSLEAAWENCILEEKSTYVQALVREGLRYYPPIPLLPPRSAFKSFTWRGIDIPKGISIYMNGQSINHDPACYGPDAQVFRPERWLQENNGFPQPGPPYHYSLGAGSRMCTAVAITNRILYATYVRLIIHFKIRASKTAPPNTDRVDFNENRADQTAIPKRFRIILEPRNEVETLERDIQKSKTATEGLYT